MFGGLQGLLPEMTSAKSQPTAATTMTQANSAATYPQAQYFGSNGTDKPPSALAFHRKQCYYGIFGTFLAYYPGQFYENLCNEISCENCDKCDC